MGTEHLRFGPLFQLKWDRLCLLPSNEWCGIPGKARQSKSLTLAPAGRVCHRQRCKCALHLNSDYFKPFTASSWQCVMCPKAVLYLSGHHSQYVASFYAQKRKKEVPWVVWKGESISSMLPSWLWCLPSLALHTECAIPSHLWQLHRVATVFLQSVSYKFGCNLLTVSPHSWFLACTQWNSRGLRHLKKEEEEEKSPQKTSPQ